MSKIDNGTVNFAVYEGANEFLGMAEVTLPEFTTIAEEIQGAGIAGNINGAYVGHLEAMTMELNFRSVTKSAIKLMEPISHQIEMRAAQQKWNNISGRKEMESVKHVAVVTPLKYAPGKLAPASPTESSGEYAVSYYALFINGEKLIEIDPINFIYYVNGTDYLDEVRKALGK